MTTVRGSEGCFGMNIYIDGTPIEQVEIDRLKEIIHYCMDTISVKQDATDMLYHVLSCLGTYTPDEDQCSDCGTWGGEYIIETNN